MRWSVFDECMDFHRKNVFFDPTIAECCAEHLHEVKTLRLTKSAMCCSRLILKLLMFLILSFACDNSTWTVSAEK